MAGSAKDAAPAAERAVCITDGCRTDQKTNKKEEAAAPHLAIAEGSACKMGTTHSKATYMALPGKAQALSERLVFLLQLGDAMDGAMKGIS